MKTRYKILIVIILISISLFVGMYVAQNERNMQDQKFMEKWRHERELLLDEIAQEKRDKENSNHNATWTFSEDYCGNWCNQNELYELGCTTPILAHLVKYSNLLDEEFDGTYWLEWIGLPDGMSKEKFDECVDFILEQRIMELENNSKTCSDDQTYNKILFKCVVSCENDLVYNGYTDSCTTEFELKYHGFCNDGFIYSPTLHECHSDVDVSHFPLKDPPRTSPPEPEPIPEPEPTYTLTEVHCFTNQVIYNDECVYVLSPIDEFPKEMTKYFSIIDDVIVNFCEIKPATKYDGENNSGITLDRCFEISHYTISDINEIEFQSTTPPTWINIKLEDWTRNVELGSSPTFTVVESGWGNGCTSPSLEVYHMKQEIGNDHTDDDLIYNHRIVYSCPYYEPVYPPQDVLRIWDESDFPNFPICEEQGKYLIIGDSGYERLPLDYYYCGMENEN